MNLLGMKVSNEQLVCCLICFLLGYHFRSLFGMEGFALNELYKAKLTEYAEDVSHTDHKSAKNLIGMEYEDNCDGYNKCVKNYKYDYFGMEPGTACQTSFIDHYEKLEQSEKDNLKDFKETMDKGEDGRKEDCKRKNNTDEGDDEPIDMDSGNMEEDMIDCGLCKTECFPDM